MSTEIIKAEKFGIEEKTATELTNGLAVPRAERKLLKEEFDKVSQLEITKENKSIFHDLRVRIMKNRTQGTNKWHKAGKEYFLRGGQFLDAIKNKDNQENEAMEQVLLDAENHFENLEKERIAKLQKERVEILSEYIEDAHERDLAQMEDDVWESFLQVKKQKHIEKIQAEKKAEEERVEAKRLEDLRIEEQRIENEKLKKEKERLEKEAKEKAELIATRTKELQPYIVFIRDYNDLISKNEVEYQKEFKDIKKGAELQWEFERKEKERKEKEEKQKQIEADKLAKIQAKKEADAEAERKRLQEELDAKNKAEKELKRLEDEKIAKAELEAKELAKAPKKQQLNNWIDNFVMGTPTGMNEDETVVDILNKFSSFKKWAKTEIDKL